MKKKELKSYLKKEVKPAYKYLNRAIKSGDKKEILNATYWMIATCEVLK